MTHAPVAELHFSKANPRLAGHGITADTRGKVILKVLWETCDVLPLVRSILAHGYFAHEPLVVRREKERLVVQDGNRRLAALKVLTNETLAREVGWEQPVLLIEIRQALQQVPVDLLPTV